LVGAVLGKATFVARRRARAAALSLAIPGFVLAVSVPVSLSSGITGVVPPVVVVAVAVGARISIPAFEEFPLAAGRAEALLGCPFSLFRTLGGEVRWRGGGEAVVVHSSIR
jgi:hypothetical protein